MAATDQVLRNAAAELSVIFYVNGVPQDADGNVTVLVTRANGTTVANVTALNTIAGDGKYEWILPPQADLTRLTLAWTGTFSGQPTTITTYADIIGGFMFTIADARAFEKGKIADTTKYPTSTIVDVREEVTQQFEDFCRVSFVPRYRREIHDGNGKSAMYLDRREVTRVQSITEDGVTLTEGVDFHVYRSGRILKDGGGGWSSLHPRNIVVDYEHGFAPTPGPIARCGMILLTNFLVGSDLHDRKIFQQDESGIFRLSFPDSSNDRPTGIPHVDARLNEYVDPFGVA